MRKHRVLLCSMDGVRPDAIAATQTPCIDGLAANGAYTWEARTVMPSVTLPCHTSMVRGVPPERHGITSNVFTPMARPVPSLFEVAAAAGLRVGMFFNWEQLRDLAAPGSSLVSICHGDCSGKHSDWYIAESAADHISRFDFDLLFVYFGFPDECGHKHGWMSQPYLDAITHVDFCLQVVQDALTRRGWADETMTLLLSDHGGHDRSHGTEMPEDMTIPWVLSGPGVKRNYLLSEPVFIYDTCTTLAHCLGLSPASAWEGKVVQEAFLSNDL
ncbi:MAG: alkaline phosphatase family protein [Armatimonadaceae bacterium]